MAVISDKEWWKSKTIWTSVIAGAVGVLQAAGVVDQATGLTSTESALLDRDEQLIRQRQRGTV